MIAEGWKYYNHAAIPLSPPNEEPNLAPIFDKSFWKKGKDGTPLFARYTTDFDCADETKWWYVIKDTPFDIASLKAKRRYEINKGTKNFEVKRIDPVEQKETLLQVQLAAFSAYPEKYRPVVEKERFFEEIAKWKEFSVFGAFHRESGELAGYALLSEESESYVGFRVLKTKPKWERFAINAAIVAGILQEYDAFLREGGILCDGARSIHHETAFQDYLEKYFEFRKAYCRLRIVYHPKIKWLIGLLYPMRKLLSKFDGIGKIHQINSVLKMEEICRSEESEKR